MGSRKRGHDEGAEAGLGGLLRGFTEFLGKLEQVADSGQPLVKSGSFELPGAGSKGRRPRGVFGFSVGVGLGGKPLRVEPFGNLRHDAETGESLMAETREPLVDVFDEDDRLLVVAELPGIDADQIQIEIEAGTLTLAAEQGDRHYQKVIEVPAGLRRDRVVVTCNNGVAEISCPKD